MPTPRRARLLGERAYTAFIQQSALAHPAWETLPAQERLAWGCAARAAVEGAHEVPCHRPVRHVRSSPPQ